MKTQTRSFQLACALGLELEDISLVRRSHSIMSSESPFSLPANSPHSFITWHSNLDSLLTIASLCSPLCPLYSFTAVYVFKAIAMRMSCDLCGKECHGHVIGGGTGLNSRAYGLACDQLVGLTMVDYQGRLLTASASENPDLLWASCGGGGGNLGIVTSYTVRLNSLDMVPQTTTIEIGWSGFDNAPQIFDAVSLQDHQKLQGRLMMMMILMMMMMIRCTEMMMMIIMMIRGHQLGWTR